MSDQPRAGDMSDQPLEPAERLLPRGVAGVQTVHDLARFLRQLRRREARRQGETQLTYRELAAKTGWSHGVIGEYFSGNILPPTDRFDTLIRLLGATPAEQGALATARDQVEEWRRCADGVAARSAVPRQLPPTLPGFIGRAVQLAELDAQLATDRRSPVVTISALAGTAGVGKTTLAVYWAHRVADRFPDGQLYVNLRGFDPSGAVMTAAEAIRGFLEALDVPPQRVPTNLPAQVGLYRSLLAGRRMLVVLDNARDVDHVRPLLPGSPTCVIVVTSRNQLCGLVATEGAQPITVDLLTAAEAWQLLARRLSADRVAAEPQGVDEIVERCARLPLALAVVAARAAAHPGFPLATLAAELREARTRLNAFDGGEPATDVRAVFSWSYQSLTDNAAQLFRLLGLHPGPEIGTPAAASLAGISFGQARRLLTELARAHLVAEHAPGRFTLHDLLRAYAVELADTLDSDAARRATVHRVFDHYLHTAISAALLLQPGRDPIIPAAPQPGTTPESLVNYGQALAWFTAEHRILLTAVAAAAVSGFDTHAWQLAWTVVDFLQRRGHWHDQATTQHIALASAQRAADRPGQANAHRDLARALARLGRYEEAHTHYRRALDLFGELGDNTGQARTHRGLGAMFDLQSRHREALHHAQQALDLYRVAGHLAGQASALNGVGWSHAILGDHRQALADCEHALALLRQTGDRHGEANTWHSLGYIHHHLGRHRQAATCYQRALKLFREIGDRYDEADTLTRLGDTHRTAGHPEAARQAWQHALTILDELGHPDAEEVRAKILAIAKTARGWNPS